jgi:hypothetical protein
MRSERDLNPAIRSDNVREETGRGQEVRFFVDVETHARLACVWMRPDKTDRGRFRRGIVRRLPEK